MPDNYYLYILESKKDNKFYIGQTDDLLRRIDDHDNGRVKATKNRRPLELVHFKSYNTRVEAINEESRLKRNGNTLRYLKHCMDKHVAPSSRG